MPSEQICWTPQIIILTCCNTFVYCNYTKQVNKQMKLMAMVCCSFWGLQIIAYSFLDQGEWDRALVVWTCRGSLREDSQKRKRNKSRHGRTRARRETWSKIDHSKDREFEVQPADNWKMGQEMAQLWMVWLSKQPILERQWCPTWSPCGTQEKCLLVAAVQKAVGVCQLALTSLLWYSGWKKSCTSWKTVYPCLSHYQPIINSVS